MLQLAQSYKACGRVRTVDSCHDKADLCGVRGAREVGVDLLRLMLVEGYEPVQDVIAGSGVVGSTFSTIRLLMFPTVVSKLVELAFIVREVVLHW